MESLLDSKLLIGIKHYGKATEEKKFSSDIKKVQDASWLTVLENVPIKLI